MPKKDIFRKKRKKVFCEMLIEVGIIFPPSGFITARMDILIISRLLKTPSLNDLSILQFSSFDYYS